MTKLILMFLSYLFISSSFADDCSPLWSGMDDTHHLFTDYVYSLPNTNNQIIIATPKALKHALKFKDSLLKLKQMPTMKLGNFTIKYSEKCDEEIILRLYEINKSVYRESSEKRFSANFNDLTSEALPEVFGKFCGIKLNINRDEKFRMYLFHPKSFPDFEYCTSIPAFLAAHGAILTLNQNRLFIQRSNNKFNMDAAKTAAPFN